MTDNDNELLARIDERTKYLSEKLEEISGQLHTDYVHRDEFDPVKRIVYGVAWVVLVAIVGAVLSLVIRKGT